MKSWQQLAVGMMVVGSLASVAIADSAPAKANSKGNRAHTATRGRSGFGFLAVLDRSIGLNDEQRDAVRSLLADQRQQSQAIREQTDQKIRNILNPEQQKKFDAFLADQRAQRSRRIAKAS